MKTCKEVDEGKIPFSADDGICGLAWCPDGQILSVATSAGDVFNFLARMPIMHASSGPRVAYLSSLREVSVIDASRSLEKPLKVPVDIEPTMVALGPLHIAVAMNDRVIFYRANNKDSSQVTFSCAARFYLYCSVMRCVFAACDHRFHRNRSLFVESIFYG